MKPIYKIIGGVLLLVVVYFVGRRDDRANQIKKEYQQTVQNTLKYSDGLKKSVDSLTRLAHQPRVDTLIRTIAVSKDSTRQLDDRLNNQIAHDSTDAALKTALLEIASQKKTIHIQDSLEIVRKFQIKELTVAVMISNQRADSLQHVLTITPPQTDCKILFVPCPSRTVVMIGSAIGGAIVVRSLTK